jgi:hypothetical protein
MILWDLVREGANLWQVQAPPQIFHAQDIVISLQGFAKFIFHYFACSAIRFKVHRPADIFYTTAEMTVTFSLFQVNKRWKDFKTLGSCRQQLRLYY